MGWPRNPLEGVTQFFFGGGKDEDEEQPRRRTRTVQAPPVQTPIIRPNAPGSNAGLIIDARLQQDLADIGRQNEIDLAEYAQRVAVANAEAGQQRRAVNRDIGIQNQYRGLALDATNAGYDQMMAELQGITPLTQQAYNTGVASVSDAYNTGVANVEAALPNVEALSQQLAAFEAPGTQVDTSSFEGEISDPLQYMSDLLTASGATGSADLAALGQGDVGAALAALPGYREEQQQELSDINLEVDATLNALRNELSMITPDFVPFNAAQMDLNNQQAIRAAMEAAAEREEEDRRYQGYTGVQDLASEFGRPDLFSEFMNITSTANAGIEDPMSGSIMDPNMAIQRGINTYQPSGATSTAGRLLQFAKEYDNPEEQARSARQAQIDRQILQQLFEVYMGSYQ